MTLTVRSTRACPNTPLVLFALEELVVDYQTAVVDDGWFHTRFAVPGPSLEDGALFVIELGAVMRHCARAYGDGALLGEGLAGLAEMDRWLDFLTRRIARAIDDPPSLAHALDILDAHLEGRDWILGAFSVVDCLYLALARPPWRARLSFDGAPRISAYLDRLVARPAVARALARVP